MHCKLHLLAGATLQFRNIFAAELFVISLRDLIGKIQFYKRGKIPNQERHQK